MSLTLNPSFHSQHPKEANQHVFFVLSALNLRQTTQPSAYLITYRSSLFSSLVSRMGATFASLITASSHPYVLLQVLSSPLFPSIIHLTSSHLFQYPFLPLYSVPFKSYLCLFSFICLSALLSLPNFALLFPSLFSCSAFKLFPSHPPPPPHPLIACSHALLFLPSHFSLPLATCHSAASKALR